VSKPPINIVSVKKAVTGGNNVGVTVLDGAGLERVINLSPSAQEQLLRALLAGQPMQKAGQPQTSQKFLLAKNVRLFEGRDGVTGLEVQLGPEIAVHILLPGLLPEALEKLLQGFRKDRSPTAH
jgi:hypothetical protein